ncbi:MAG: hypothetical protein JWO11_4132 [Nocardioides sp.]|nr:hypothetical protein [Nocardioides sp.]
MTDDDIRRRLQAVEGIDWMSMERRAGDEIYGSWARIGDRVVLADYGAETEPVVDFFMHAAADLRRLLAERDTTVTNEIYGKPPEGTPVTLLSDAVVVMRPNGQKVVMDLVALADVAIRTERALAGLTERLEQLSQRVSALEGKAGRQERAGRILAGGGEYEEPDEDLEERLRALERRADDEVLRIKEGRD